MTDIEAIKKRLAEYYTPEETELWLSRQQPLLNGECAIELIRAGRSVEVNRVLDQLDEAVYL